MIEHGPRHLWDEILALVTDWDQHGRPPAHQHGLTIHQDGTHLLWLDHPGQVIRTL